VAGYEITEVIAKALAKAIAAVKTPSSKVSSEVAFFAAVLATVGIDFESLSPSEAIACQDVLFSAWQGSAERRAELEAEAEAREAANAVARLEALEKRAERSATRRENLAKAIRREEENAAELEALRAKFGA
jgi:hypothetical protein